MILMRLSPCHHVGLIPNYTLFKRPSLITVVYIAPFFLSTAPIHSLFSYSLISLFVFTELITISFMPSQFSFKPL